MIVEKEGVRPFLKPWMQVLPESFFELFVERAKQKVTNVQTGVFQAMMHVGLTNDGPVTILLDSSSRP